jgi:hypothetical protein
MLGFSYAVIVDSHLTSRILFIERTKAVNEQVLIPGFN